MFCPLRLMSWYKSFMSSCLKPTAYKSAVAFMVIGLIAGLAFLPACKKNIPHDAFAKCLAAKQVKMYGLYWCERCAKQKEMFSSSFQYITYVECGIKGSRAEEPSCTQAGVQNFPTWK